MQDVSDDVPTDDTADDMQDVSDDVPSDDTADDMQDVSDDVPSDDTVDDMQDVPDDVPTDETADDMQDVFDDVPADETVDDMQDVSDDVPADETVDDMQDVSENVPTDETADDMQDVPDDVPSNDTTDDMQDVSDDVPEDETADDQAGLDTNDHEAAPETLENINPETSGEFAPADNPYKDEWEKFADDYSDGYNADWDSLSDVPFAGDTSEELPDATEQPKDYDSVSDYMNDHNYGQDDFDTYSQDPVWRDLQSKEFPDYELPPLTQENAYNQLSDYMNSHDYTPDDFDTYSQDPQWRELQSAAFPDYELPPLKNTESPEYADLKHSLNDTNIDYRPIERADVRTPNEIIDSLSGGDCTDGSCSSLALAYAGNKAGYEVLDFRGGESQEFFSSRDNIEKISNLPGVESQLISGTNDIDCANQLLQNTEPGKEYYLATGQHAAIVKQNGNGFDYLELQHPSSGNGWHPLDNDVLTNRFGCSDSHSMEFSNYLMDVDSLSNNEEFLDILGYINTANHSQMKGNYGNVK